MSDMERTAKAFFEACETGEGWEACKQFCKPDATFSCQADALADVKTLPGIYRLDERLIWTHSRRGLCTESLGR